MYAKIPSLIAKSENMIPKANSKSHQKDFLPISTPRQNRLRPSNPISAKKSATSRSVNKKKVSLLMDHIHISSAKLLPSATPTKKETEKLAEKEKAKASSDLEEVGVGLK